MHVHVPFISHVAGFIANISSNVAFLPQILKSYRRKKVEDVIIRMFWVLFTTQICWIMGLLKSKGIPQAFQKKIRKTS